MEKVAQEFIAFEFTSSQAELIDFVEAPQLISLDMLEQIGGGESEGTSLPAKGW